MRNGSQGRGKCFGCTIHVCCVHLPCEMWLLGTLKFSLLLHATRSVFLGTANGPSCQRLLFLRRQLLFADYCASPPILEVPAAAVWSDEVTYFLLVYEYAGTEPRSRLRPSRGTTYIVFNHHHSLCNFRWRHSLNHEARFSSWMEKWLPVISGGLTEFNSPMNDTMW
jgi:hypothetical protein